MLWLRVAWCWAPAVTGSCADIGVDGERIATIVPAARPAATDTVVELAGALARPGSDRLPRAPHSADRRPRSGRRRARTPPSPCSPPWRRRTLDAGVTTVRDVGGWNYVEMAVRDAIRTGQINGPRMFLAGRLLSITTATVEYYPGMYEVADGVDAVRRAVRASSPTGPT